MSGKHVDAGKLFKNSRTKMTMQYKDKDAKTKRATIDLYYKGIPMGTVKGVIHEPKTN